MKTAVEWLLNEFQEANKNYGGLDTNWLKRFDQALEMEKQQIIEAHGIKKRISGGTGNYEYLYKGADYYNDKFKKDKS